MKEENKGLIDILDKEFVLIDRLITKLDSFRQSIIKKDSTQYINSLLAEIDLLSKEFQEADAERDRFVADISSSYNIPNAIKDIVDFFSVTDKDVALKLAGLVEKMQNLTFTLDCLHQALDFENSYNNLLLNMLNIDKTGKNTYAKSGYSKNNYQSKLNWEG